MPSRKGRVGLACLAFLIGAAAPVSAAPKLEIAITIDDLPVHAPYPKGVTPQQVADQMIAALKAARAPAYGFVNAVRNQEEQGSGSVLTKWRAGGLMLGNHGFAHLSLGNLTVADFERELVRNESALKAAAAGTDWHWFRYPFIDEGKDAAQREAARKILLKHKYRIAAVTTGFSDWRWTQPYARCASAGDAAAVRELERLYMAAVSESIAVDRENARKLYGRDIPYVLLMHVSAMSARMIPQVLQKYRDAGFTFVSLPQAERDSVYRAYTDLKLPAPQFPQEVAAAKGLKLAAQTDYSAKVDEMCPVRS